MRALPAPRTGGAGDTRRPRSALLEGPRNVAQAATEVRVLRPGQGDVDLLLTHFLSKLFHFFLCSVLELEIKIGNECKIIIVNAFFCCKGMFYEKQSRGLKLT